MFKIIVFHYSNTMFTYVHSPLLVSVRPHQAAGDGERGLEGRDL